MIVIRPFSDLSPATQRQCRGLTFREGSGILPGLKDEPNATCFVRFVGKRVVSWGVMFETMAPWDLVYMTFTRRSERGKGYGKEVMMAAKRWRAKKHKGVKVALFNASNAATAMWSKYSFYDKRK